MEKFTIDQALKEYEEISYMYKGGYITKEAAKKELGELNKKCKENSITFEAEFSSLIPHLDNEKNSEEDDSSSEAWNTDWNYDDDSSY